MSVRSTQHHTLLHYLTILHTKKFFAPLCHPCKIYCCMSAQSTKHHTFLHNHKILHTKTFFAPACHQRQKISSTSKYVSNAHLSQTISLFLILGQSQGQGQVPIIHSTEIGINNSTRLHKLPLIFISTFFASTITLTKIWQCQNIHIISKFYTLTKTGWCQVLLFKIPNVRPL